MSHRTYVTCHICHTTVSVTLSVTLSVSVSVVVSVTVSGTVSASVSLSVSSTVCVNVFVTVSLSVSVSISLSVIVTVAVTLSMTASDTLSVPFCHGCTACNIEDMIMRIGVMVASSMKILSCYINRTSESGRNCMLPVDLSDCLSCYEVVVVVPHAIVKI